MLSIVLEDHGAHVEEDTQAEGALVTVVANYLNALVMGNYLSRPGSAMCYLILNLYHDEDLFAVTPPLHLLYVGFPVA